MAAVREENVRNTSKAGAQSETASGKVERAEEGLGTRTKASERAESVESEVLVPARPQRCGSSDAAPRRGRHQKLSLTGTKDRRIPVVPAPLNASSKVSEATLKDVPTISDLRNWLWAEGDIDTAEWGKDGTKDVSKLWKEIKTNEAALEVWRSEEGAQQVVRVTHVLRAKVCTAESRERGIFLFNTWQQFASGKKRTRNGLLSEKLSTAEMPLEVHLEEVCRRAVTVEEMQCVVDAAYQVGPGQAPPQYDALVKCPITVKETHFVDHTMEVEISKSFPGLLTLYHLYTVEIVCEGLPCVDFNTLEWEAEKEGDGKSLKYVHAWVWLEWSQIQRYLFEGSELKERKTKGSFKDAGSLSGWLEQFEIELRPSREDDDVIIDLFEELERGEFEFELWGRKNGTSLLMQVAHVLQIRVVSADPRLQGKFLLRTWEQGWTDYGQDVGTWTAKVQNSNELLMSTLTMSEVPYKEGDFVEAAGKVVRTQLRHITEAHFRLRPDAPPKREKYEASDVEVSYHEFKQHTFRTDESPLFRGLYIMQHLYNMDVLVDGLPVADFTGLDFERSGGPLASGWKWVTVQQAMDILQAKARDSERNRLATQTLFEMCVDSGRRAAEGLGEVLETLVKTTKDENVDRLGRLHLDLKEEFSQTFAPSATVSPLRDTGLSSIDLLPPSMISKIAGRTIALDSYLEEAYHANIVRTAVLHGQMANGMLEQESNHYVGRCLSMQSSFNATYSRLSASPTKHSGDLRPLPPVSPPKDVPAPDQPNAILETSAHATNLYVVQQVLDAHSAAPVSPTTAKMEAMLCHSCQCDSVACNQARATAPSTEPAQKSGFRRFTVTISAIAFVLFSVLHIAVGVILLDEAHDERQVTCVLILMLSAFAISICAATTVWARKVYAAPLTAAPLVALSAWEVA